MDTRENFKVILHADKALKPQEAHCRTYNLPSASEVATIIPSTCIGNLDVIVHCREGRLTRINMCHRSYNSLHYVLLFPHGTDGWQIGLRRNNGRTISPTYFYSYRLQVREDVFNIVMRARRLTQQYAVDAQAKIEYSRLKWVRNNQTTIRSEKYQGLQDAVIQGDGVNAGR